jgi:PhzF family phenazine biosynthesis protein
MSKATFAFHQVDVFTDTPTCGNPLAVVVGADELSDDQMARFAKWTNLSETTFLLRPTHPEADYRVRIFTPDTEFPFAGHPTLGSCHAWLAQGGQPKAQHVVQECGIGLVSVRRDNGRLAFSAPKPLRSGAVAAELLAHIAHVLRIEPSTIVDSQWVDNGPGWVAIMLGSREEVLQLEPDYSQFNGLQLGVIAPWRDAHADAQFEVRAFMSTVGSPEDPVTGSLNASLAQWLIGSGQAPTSYIASQGTALGRRGRVHVQQVDGTVWVGGAVVDCIRGTLTL